MSQKTIVRKDEQKSQVKGIEEFIKGIYSLDIFTDDELKAFYDSVQYQGFSREEVLKQLNEQVGDPKIICELSVVCALRGPVKGSSIKLTNGKTSTQMGIPSSGGKGDKKLTMNKILSATADLAAFYLKKCDVPKRIDSELPGWLQFPSAGSIKLPEKFRGLHRDFSKTFSKQIGGEFNESIYESMIRNSYYDTKLMLF
jgi:hypothetical protein